MKPSDALIIFARNPVRGKVKTRLAATVGTETAYEAYKCLLAHTHRATQNYPADKIVYYADHVASGDLWDKGYRKALQRGADLGERMQHAFAEVLGKGYPKAVLIGTDCPSLHESILREAFEGLENHDVVIGPAYDGGYYLIGMRAPRPSLFQGIAWSTATVFKKTTAICRQSGLRYAVLPQLHDIDEEKDLVHLWSALSSQHIMSPYR